MELWWKIFWITGKVGYMYEHLDSSEKLEETELPSKEIFYSKLNLRDPFWYKHKSRAASFPKDSFWVLWACIKAKILSVIPKGVQAGASNWNKHVLTFWKSIWWSITQAVRCYPKANKKYMVDLYCFDKVITLLAELNKTTSTGGKCFKITNTWIKRS